MKRPATFGIVSWLLSLGLYLLFAGKADPSELAAGVATATVTVLLLRLLRDKFKEPLLMRTRWFVLLWRIPWAMLSESWLLLTALLRQLSGRPTGGVFIERDYPGPADEHDPARRAYMVFGVCITPNSYLVYQDKDKKRVLIRQLVGKELSRVDRLFVELP